jgi:hypothetical protein
MPQPLPCSHPLYLQCLDSTRISNSNKCMTNITGMLAAGGVWYNSAIPLRVAVLEINGQYARVQVCRSTTPCTGEPQGEQSWALVSPLILLCPLSLQPYP